LCGHGLSAQEEFKNQVNNPAGIAVFGELLGKGYYSMNVDFRLHQHHRISFGLTSLEYDTKRENPLDEESSNHTWLSPGIMYYYLPGTNRSSFELGAGISTSPFLNEDYNDEEWTDHPLSLHGVIGYRYQKKNGLLFRAGFTPFYRPRVWFLPLIGLSLGYSW